MREQGITLNNCIGMQDAPKIEIAFPIEKSSPCFTDTALEIVQFSPLERRHVPSSGCGDLKQIK